jgi:hypothetical protein
VTRYRIITTQGRSQRSVWADSEQEARAVAAERFRGSGVPAMVVKHPRGGLVSPICVVGQVKAVRR